MAADSRKQENSDQIFCRRSLELASAGIGMVSPGPLVGCVIVSVDGEVVGEGTYFYDNIVHAEVIALEQAGERARGGTAYVSLEPHAHHGKTRPCTDALIEAGIKRVVAPIEDPNPRVSGRGFEKLRESGIEVVTGMFGDEAARLNEKFICWHRKQRPFVHLKLAMSLDGRISLNRSVSTALSGESASKRVHQLRHEHDAILVGGNTAVVDNPSLTDRSGKPRRRPLARIILDNRLRIGLDSKLVLTAAEAPTIIFTDSHEHDKIVKLREQGVDVVTGRGGRDLPALLEELKARSIQSVLVEGGSEVAGAFRDAALIDKVTLIAAPILIGGREAPVAIAGSGAGSIGDALRLSGLTVEQLGDDVEITGYPA